MLIELRRIQKAFAGLQVLESVNYAFASKGVYFLLGTNGSGKSTLLNIITGLTAPDRGAVVFDGQNITRKEMHTRTSAGIRRSFQSGKVLSSLTVEDNLRLACGRPLDVGTARTDYQAIEAALRFFTLAEVRTSLSRELSFGQRKLLGLAMAMVLPARALLLDEPAAGLLPGLASRLAARLRESDELVIVVDHNLDFLSQLEGTGLFLHSGRIATTGTFDEILASDVFRRAYI